MYEKSLEMRRLLVFHYPAEVRLAPSWAAGVAGEGLGVKRRLQPSRLNVQWKAARSQNGNFGLHPSIHCGGPPGRGQSGQGPEAKAALP